MRGPGTNQALGLALIKSNGASTQTRQINLAQRGRDHIAMYI